MLFKAVYFHFPLFSLFLCFFRVLFAISLIYFFVTFTFLQKCVELYLIFWSAYFCGCLYLIFSFYSISIQSLFISIGLSMYISFSFVLYNTSDTTNLSCSLSLSFSFCFPGISLLSHYLSLLKESLNLSLSQIIST